MTIEMTLLVWSTTLFGAYIGVQAILYRVDKGIKFAASGRDNEEAGGVYTARAEKALRNLIETYAVFVVLAVATELSGRSDGMTVWGAQIWFWSRWVYLPLYVFGVAYIRSLVWNVAAIGLILMFLGVAF